jgi:hypothetical protein
LATEPLTDAEIAQLRASLTPAVLRGMPKLLYRALPRVFEELLERRARAGDHVAVMDIAYDYSTVLRDWNARARAVLGDLPPVGRGDQVTIPRELYERLLALK